MARLYRNGKLGAASKDPINLLQVSVADDSEYAKSEDVEVIRPRLCAIHIKLPGEIRISLGGSVE
ncbi:hypothetical protein HDF16_003570 [Granulicella aggregans]|uniref:Uncharacterized protein n=1 Tax=Granulicella aggregans TaxID=474949 RepID=A0A7W8E4P1_9BACT|nr:hypothetical protein [Granulicella aggregans]